jgi:hypothetical protein
MKSKRFLVMGLAVFSLGLVSCRHYVGYSFYPSAPQFRKTHPTNVILLNSQPRRAHIELGEVWIRPTPRMSAARVESKLRKKAARLGADALVIIEDKYLGSHRVVSRRWRGMIAYRERVIVGIAIRFR